MSGARKSGGKPMVRARVVFRGTVQGVGFRYSTMRVASGYGVTGYVRNESDGSVLLVAEGGRGEVEGFVAAVSERMAGYIRSADATWGEASGEFDEFGMSFSW